MKKARILVVGSGSAAPISGDWDEVFCSNSSLSRISYKKNIIHICSENMFMSNHEIKIKENINKKSFFLRKKVLEDSETKELIICKSSFTDTYLYESIDENNYQANKVAFFTIKDRNRVIFRILGLTIWLKAWFEMESPKPKLWRFVASLVRGGNVPHNLKPSTGVFALIYAIYVHKKRAKYYIDGISINRECSFYGKDKFKNIKNDGHMPFDRHALNTIKNKYMIVDRGTSIS
jgi:hypothetical protein